MGNAGLLLLFKRKCIMIKISPKFHQKQHIPRCTNPPFVGFQKTAALKNILTCSDTFTHLSQKCCNLGNFNCKKYSICNQALQIRECTHPSAQPKIYFKYHTTCNSLNIVYIILCPYLKLYVGTSIHVFKMHIMEHKYLIRTNSLVAPLVFHFLEVGHRK